MRDQAMLRIREFHRSDIPRVADLWMRAFRASDEHAPQPVHAYFEEMFFETPWRDAQLPSLVCERGAGSIAGFLGVLPRRMLYKGEPLRLAVATQLMVDPGAPSYAAASLMRRFLGGAQDLSLSDGANEAAERLWQACGGETALLFNLAWTRVLRPIENLRARLRRRAGESSLGMALAPLVASLRPACQTADAFAAHIGGARWRPEVEDALLEEEPTAANLAWCIENLGKGRALRPDYERHSLAWLLEHARDKQVHGELRGAVLREPCAEQMGDPVGWFLYYARPGSPSQVLQFGGRPRWIGAVLDHLFRAAWSDGATAVTGELEPRFAKDLARRRCRFNWPGYSVVMHSRRPELLAAIHRGDAFLTRLEGEWWTRFSDPAWTAETSRQPELETLTPVAQAPGLSDA
jgi:hypothetical protein